MAEVYNKTKDFKISGNVKVFDTFLSRMKGLMFEKKKTGGVLEFGREQYYPSVHTWFCKYPLDIYFVNKSRRVMKAYKNVKPWSVAITGKKAKWILELPSKVWNIEEGDVLEFLK